MLFCNHMYVSFIIFIVFFLFCCYVSDVCSFLNWTRKVVNLGKNGSWKKEIVGGDCAWGIFYERRFVSINTKKYFFLRYLSYRKTFHIAINEITCEIFLHYTTFAEYQSYCHAYKSVCFLSDT